MWSATILASIWPSTDSAYDGEQHGLVAVRYCDVLRKRGSSSSNRRNNAFFAQTAWHWSGAISSLQPSLTQQYLSLHINLRQEPDTGISKAGSCGTYRACVAPIASSHERLAHAAYHRRSIVAGALVCRCEGRTAMVGSSDHSSTQLYPSRLGAL